MPKMNDLFYDGKSFTEQLLTKLMFTEFGIDQIKKQEWKIAPLKTRSPETTRLLLRMFCNADWRSAALGMAELADVRLVGHARDYFTQFHEALGKAGFVVKGIPNDKDTFLAQTLQEEIDKYGAYEEKKNLFTGDVANFMTDDELLQYNPTDANPMSYFTAPCPPLQLRSRVETIVPKYVAEKLPDWVQKEPFATFPGEDSGNMRVWFDISSAHKSLTVPRKVFQNGMWTTKCTGNKKRSREAAAIKDYKKKFVTKIVQYTVPLSPQEWIVLQPGSTKICQFLRYFDFNEYAGWFECYLDTDELIKDFYKMIGWSQRENTHDERINKQMSISQSRIRQYLRICDENGEERISRRDTLVIGSAIINEFNKYACTFDVDKHARLLLGNTHEPSGYVYEISDIIEILTLDHKRHKLAEDSIRIVDGWLVNYPGVCLCPLVRCQIDNIVRATGRITEPMKCFYINHVNAGKKRLELRTEHVSMAIDGLVSEKQTSSLQKFVGDALWDSVSSAMTDETHPHDAGFDGDVDADGDVVPVEETDVD